jgi:hypothetical protein
VENGINGSTTIMVQEENNVKGNKINLDLFRNIDGVEILLRKR